MKFRTGLLFFLLPVALAAQTRSDTIRMIQQQVKWYDLEFSDAEVDSLIGNMNNYLMLYKGMHRMLPTNDIPYPFAFRPGPPGMTIPNRKEKIFWDIPAKQELPTDRTELSFFSLPQLASLIRNKKISSVELTRFF